MRLKLSILRTGFWFPCLSTISVSAQDWLTRNFRLSSESVGAKGCDLLHACATCSAGRLQLVTRHSAYVDRRRGAWGAGGGGRAKEGLADFFLPHKTAERVLPDKAAGSAGLCQDLNIYTAEAKLAYYVNCAFLCATLHPAESFFFLLALLLAVNGVLIYAQALIFMSSPRCSKMHRGR